MYRTTVILNIFLIIIGTINLGLNLIFAFFVRQIGIFEREKMLTLSVLFLHAKEYTEEFNSKVKELIGENDRDLRNKQINSEYNDYEQNQNQNQNENDN